jgi:uncharacterized membrane protein YeaQ/YmgE (transglycosylase-associated protein family)
MHVDIPIPLKWCSEPEASIATRLMVCKQFLGKEKSALQDVGTGVGLPRCQGPSIKIQQWEARMGTTLVQVIVNLISGGVGGNIAGALLKNFNLGPVGNTIVGLLGGGLGGQLLSATGLLQSTGMVGGIAGSAVGGGVLMAIVGLIKNAMAAKA